MPEAATDADILWCLKIAVSSYSFGSCDGLADMFRNMVPDSTIAEKFCLQKDKCAHFINYGIEPHFCSILMDNIKDSEFYAISFDESLKTVMQVGQMDFVANFWENVAYKVCTYYLDSIAKGHARHQDLFQHVILVLDSLDLKELLQVSVDGPNVN